MNPWKLFLGLGVILILAGGLLWAAQYVPGLSKLGQLPGDLKMGKGNFRVYIPLTTSILLSVVLSLAFYLARKLR